MRSNCGAAKLLAFFDENPRTTQELVDMSKMSRYLVEKHIRELFAINKITRHGTQGHHSRYSYSLPEE